MVVVLTDNPFFLGAFAEFSLKNYLLVSSTKLLAITTLPLRILESIEFFHKAFSRMDSMILILDDSGTRYLYQLIYNSFDSLNTFNTAR